MNELTKIRLNTPEVSQNAYAVYEALRDQGGILWSDRHKAWLVSRYDYVKEILLSTSSSVEKIKPFVDQASGDIQEGMQFMHRVMEYWLPFMDPPEHTRLRLILQRSFTPRSLQLHEGMIRDVARQVIEGFGDRREIEFHDEFAFQFPALTITRLFGLPTSEVGLIKEWAEGIAEFVLGSGKPDRYENSAAMMKRMNEYFSALVASRSAELEAMSDPSPETLLDELLFARKNVNGLTDEEIVSSLILILFAAPETTASMLANSMLSLILNKPRLQELVTDPSRIGPALDELIRYDGPVPAVVRLAKDDLVVGGETIKAGERIFLLLKSANRDPAQFPNPETLDFSRGRSPHVGFGIGVHLCLGAPLARLEARIAFEELFAKYKDFELPEQEIVWRHELLAHAPHQLRVAMIPHEA